jgi:hypothetical protein
MAVFYFEAVSNNPDFFGLFHSHCYDEARWIAANVANYIVRAATEPISSG